MLAESIPICRPSDPSCFRDLMEDYVSRCTDLPRKILRGIALALGEPLDMFEGLLTLINQDDDITALQVSNIEGEWIPATPVPGTFVCNIGDMLKILTNGIYESIVHQTNYDAAVEPLEICVERSGGAKKFMGSIWYDIARYVTRDKKHGSESRLGTR
ncbi:hypothetical protein SASPL_101783 [Salvia splendens]|uniref:Isopenicillin N synthase-like Fe(2+) 2OG dioxygenase domain-containing protein n=1 Tax=Salvia splendens TaxID=180675 RepID=A0A8X8YRF3_SALSN|nr:hypothetical protein SASPL_101783 [Salvia splendens]